MIEIPQDEIEAWKVAQVWAAKDGYHPRNKAVYLALSNLVLRALAGWERSEFEREHRLAQILDPRHTWTHEQWQQAVRKQLEER
jgi:hypothetical protein